MAERNIIEIVNKMASPLHEKFKRLICDSVTVKMNFNKNN